MKSGCRDPEEGFKNSGLFGVMFWVLGFKVWGLAAKRLGFT